MNLGIKRLFLEIALYLLFNLISANLFHISLTIVSQALLLIIVVGIARKIYPDK